MLRIDTRWIVTAMTYETTRLEWTEGCSICHSMSFLIHSAFARTDLAIALTVQIAGPNPASRRLILANSIRKFVEKSKHDSRGWKALWTRFRGQVHRAGCRYAVTEMKFPVLKFCNRSGLGSTMAHAFIRSPLEPVVTRATML